MADWKNAAHNLARDVDESSSKEKVFLASYPFLFRLILFGSLASLLLILVFDHRFSFMRFFLSAVVPGTILSALMSVPLTWFYRVRVTPDGIHGGTFWSTPVYMKFSEMETVEPRNFLGLPYLRVKSFRESCPTLWIPRFLADPAGLREEIALRTSSLQPLRRSLENNFSAETRGRNPVS